MSRLEDESKYTFPTIKYATQLYDSRAENCFKLAQLNITRHQCSSGWFFWCFLWVRLTLDIYLAVEAVYPIRCVQADWVWHPALCQWDAPQSQRNLSSVHSRTSLQRAECWMSQKALQFSVSWSWNDYMVTSQAKFPWSSSMDQGWMSLP